MLLGKVLAVSAMEENKCVSWLPAYGPEVRGGSAHCTVVISDEEISSPCVDKADTLIVMNGLALKRFQDRVRTNGLLIVNESLSGAGVHRNKLTVLHYPFTDIASGMGNIKVANMVALGCYIAKKKTVDAASVIAAMLEIAPKGRADLIEINKKALLSGMELIK